MPSYILLAAIMVVGVCLAPSAEAGFVSGADLLGICSPAKVDPVYRLKVAECRGYVIGVADTFDCSNPATEFTWNSETSVTQEGLVVAVVKWLRKNPQNLRYQANNLVAAALSTEFPCSRQESKN